MKCPHGEGSNAEKERRGEGGINIMPWPRKPQMGDRAAMAENNHGITVTSTSSNLQTNKQTTSWQRKPQMGDRAAMAETKHDIAVTSTSSNLQTNKQTTSWQRKPQLGDRAVRVKIKG